MRYPSGEAGTRCGFGRAACDRKSWVQAPAPEVVAPRQMLADRQYLDADGGASGQSLRSAERTQLDGAPGG
jgi:hypothetical protein